MKKLLLVAALVWAPSLALAEEATTTNEVAVKPGTAIVVEDDAGAVQVLPGAAGAVKVEARRRAETREAALALLVQVVQRGDELWVRYREERRPSSHTVAFIIHAPVGTRLTVSTGGGSIETTQMGAQELKSGGGAITAIGGSSLRLHTGGGSIKTIGRLIGENRISSSGGSIHVAIPSNSRLRVEGDSGGGSVENDFGLPVSGVGARRMSGTIGDGKEGSLEMHTGGGSVRLEQVYPK